jgi:1-deoxy-D-xylulose-5-phosphate reductoisomerase
MSRGRGIILLGSTGSIGRSTLEVVARHPGRWRIIALAANSNIRLLLRQTKIFKPQVIAIADPGAAEKIQETFRTWNRPPRVLAGRQGIRKAATLPGADLVVSAIVGTAGLLPTLDAIRSGKDIALANKETLVMAGDLIIRAVKKYGVKLLPVDSEHAALAQCLRGHEGVPVRRLILTASGGPFAQVPAAQLRKVTAQKALRHPTWLMGPKITVDSSTLMNKGLEVIEAHHLFGIPYDRIEVVIHSQSIVHSLVEFIDGSVLAQMSSPDMRLPIQTALTDPERISGMVKPLRFKSGLDLSFGPPDHRRFPCLRIACQAGQRAGTAPTVLNAANETAVQAFLDRRLDFMGIPRVVSRVLRRHRNNEKANIKNILKADAWARGAAKEAIKCSL